MSSQCPCSASATGAATARRAVRPSCSPQATTRSGMPVRPHASSSPSTRGRPGLRLARATVSTREPELRAGEEKASTTGSPGAFKMNFDENELMSSTWEHRAWVWGTSTFLAITFASGLAGVQDTWTCCSVTLAMVAAYYMADFGTGVYHWSVDNYGSAETPIVGKQIAAFQGHHVRPWTITQREFCNNVHQVFRPAIAPSFLLAAFSAMASPAWNVWASTFIFLACMSQQFHAWSHMKKSQLPGYIVALQDAGVLISRKAHGAHHRAPFEGNYCIVSGFWNPILDKDGADDGFFRQLERLLAARTGVEPRCWHEPAYDWAAQEEPEES